MLLTLRALIRIVYGGVDLNLQMLGRDNLPQAAGFYISVFPCFLSHPAGAWTEILCRLARASVAHVRLTRHVSTSELSAFATGRHVVAL